MQRDDYGFLACLAALLVFLVGVGYKAGVAVMQHGAVEAHAAHWEVTDTGYPVFQWGAK